MVLTTTQGQADLPRYFAKVYEMLGHLGAGRLDVRLPDGRVFRVDGKRPGVAAELDVHNPDLFARLIREGDLGFSDAYLDGWWSTPDLQAFMDLVHASTETVYDDFPAMGLVRAYERLPVLAATKSQGTSKKEHLAPLRSGERFLRVVAG